MVKTWKASVTTEEGACHRAVSEGVMIPTGTRKIIQRKASHPLAIGSWLVESLQKDFGKKSILLARSLIQGEGHMPPVEVMNPMIENTECIQTLTWES